MERSGVSITTLSLLGKEEAAKIDAILMGEGIQYTLEQLMELAGLACAQSIDAVYSKERKVALLIGPGNNGGDGIVCSRHLKLFGFDDVTVVICKPTTNPYFLKLIRQAECCGVTIKADANDIHGAEILVDALFGFSGRSGIPPDPFLTAYNLMLKAGEQNQQLVCIDVPSGWDVDVGPIDASLGKSLNPDLLISLTLPKKCTSALKPSCRHFVGGRFIPRKLSSNLKLPVYPGSAQIVEVFPS